MDTQTETKDTQTEDVPTLDELFEEQLIRVRHRLSGFVSRASARRRERMNQTLQDMDFEHRMNVILHGGMGPKRKNLSQLDGDLE